MQTKTHTTKLPVLWTQMDSNGHVSNGTYQFFMDEARMQALEDLGFSIQTMRTQGIGPVVLEANLKYNKPLSHPDSVLVETYFESETQIRSFVIQNMYRSSDGELVCAAKFSAIFYDFAKKRPWKLPQFFFDADISLSNKR
ncbi:acyl-CoA thioesterase [Leptospira sp. 96542]|nr:acyl-CoA thioesterase [Leptospira sp. 96542]